MKGNRVYADNAATTRPFPEAILAAKAGLPDRIVHLIATHSFEGDRSFQTAESVFVRTIDMFVFNCSVRGLKKK